MYCTMRRMQGEPCGPSLHSQIVITLVQTSLDGASPAARSALPILSARAIPAASVLILAAIAPFEAPLFTLGPLTFTTVELAALTAVSASVAAIVYARQPFVWRTPITRAAVACLLVLFA